MNCVFCENCKIESNTLEDLAKHYGFHPQSGGYNIDDYTQVGLCRYDPPPQPVVNADDACSHYRTDKRRYQMIDPHGDKENYKDED